MRRQVLPLGMALLDSAHCMAGVQQASSPRLPFPPGSKNAMDAKKWIPPQSLNEDERNIHFW